MYQSMQGFFKRRRACTPQTMAGVSEDALNAVEKAKEAACAGRFLYNDSSTADVVLRLVSQQCFEPNGGGAEEEDCRIGCPSSRNDYEESGGEGSRSSEVLRTSEVPEDLSSNCEQPMKTRDGDSEAFETKLYLHESVLVQCRYFAARLSGRWQDGVDTVMDSGKRTRDKKLAEISLIVAPSVGMQAYEATLQLLYTKDFPAAINNVQVALSILTVAAELLFDECINSCVRYLEVVPWTSEEEQQIVQVVTFLQLEQSAEVLARLNPVKETALEDMLYGMVYSATHQNVTCVKGFVAKMLKTYASRETVGRVLDKAFASSLKTVKESVEEYSSPNVRGRHDEIEALQRQNLRIADACARQLLWLVERMLELKVASNAVTQWSELGSFTANLERAFSEDAVRIAPGLPSSVLRCTCRLANAVATGSILASREVRRNLVKGWLPVLIVSRENAKSESKLSAKWSELLELEEVFLRIILTLPMADSQELLQQCLSFATRSLEDCRNLVTAFNTWFRRAGGQPVTNPEPTKKPSRG